MRYLLVIIILFGYRWSGAQITPEFEIGVKGVFSGNVNVNSNASNAISDFSDTQLLLGLRQKLYNDWRARFTFGLQFPDANSDLGEVFYNHIFMQMEDEKNIIKVGRTLAQTILNEFPTLRDDDAQRFVYALNPFSNGENTQRDQYANVLEYTRVFRQRIFLSVHGENFYNSLNVNDFRLNALGGSLVYRVPESQMWNRNVLQEVGLSYNNYFTKRVGYDSDFDSSVKNLILSTTINLKRDPIDFVDFKAQVIQNFGWDELSKVEDYSDYTRTKSNAFYAMVRYAKRKMERLNYQLSMGVGYKQFPNAEISSNQMIYLFNGFYRLGENFDVGLQYRYMQNTGYTEKLFDKNTHIMQLGLIYSFDKVFNKQFGDRNDLLNLEHSYLK